MLMTALGPASDTACVGVCKADCMHRLARYTQKLTGCIGLLGTTLVAGSSHLVLLLPLAG